MGNNKKEGGLGRKVAELDQRVADIALKQKHIDQLLKVKSSWRSETASWIGEAIEVRLLNGVTLIGDLKWVDQYQFAIVPVGREEDDPRIINKEAVAYIELSRGPNGE